MKRKEAKSPSLEEIKAKDPRAFAELEYLGRKLIWSTITAGVRQGKLKLSGKSKDQIAKILERHLRQVSRSEIAWSIDHKSTLLEEAQSAFERKLPIVAVILLATYFEHYLNELVLIACNRAHISDSLAQRLIRTTPFPEKVDKLIPELGFTVIPLPVRTAICSIGKIRNETVHYKWEGLTERETRVRDDRLNSVLKCGFIAASKLSIYDRDTFLKDLADLEVHFPKDALLKKRITGE